MLDNVVKLYWLAYVWTFALIDHQPILWWWVCFILHSLVELIQAFPISCFQWVIFCCVNIIENVPNLVTSHPTLGQIINPWIIWSWPFNFSSIKTHEWSLWIFSESWCLQFLKYSLLVECGWLLWKFWENKQTY